MSCDDSLSSGTPPGNTIWNLPFDCASADLVIIPVPWEVTVSFRTGTAGGPKAVLAASPHVDLFDDLYPEAWKRGIAMLELPERLEQEGRRLRVLAELQGQVLPLPALEVVADHAAP